MIIIFFSLHNYVVQVRREEGGWHMPRAASGRPWLPHAPPPAPCGLASTPPPPCTTQLLTTRERAYPLRAAKDPWFGLFETVVFVSLLLTTLIVARNPLTTLGLDWPTSSVRASDFVLGVIVLAVVLFYMRGWIVAGLRRVGAEGLMGGSYTDRALLQRIRAYLSFLEEELFGKANRVYLAAEYTPSLATSSGVLAEMRSAANAVAESEPHLPVSSKAVGGGSGV